MSNKANQTIVEYRFENGMCQECGLKLTNEDEWSNMAVKHGRNDICRECRHNINIKNLRSVRLAH